MKIECKTGEIVNSLNKYYQTIHWKNIIRTYMESDLSKRCFRCKKECIPVKFHHRTKKRLGNEKLTDIVPLCFDCIGSKLSNSKKKTERHELCGFGFNKNMSEAQKNKILLIEPKLRGNVLSKYYSRMAGKYNPSQTWINNQVKLTCKWIKKQEKALMIQDFDV